MYGKNNNRRDAEERRDCAEKKLAKEPFRAKPADPHHVKIKKLSSTDTEFRKISY